MILLLVGVFALVACSEGSGGVEPSNDTNDEETSGKSDDNRYGGSLTIAMIDTPNKIDPVEYTGVYESHITRSVADTLVIYNDDLSEIEPSLATEWEVSDDLRVYTFKLREDAYFHPGEYQDGRQMTAEDVKFSLERSANESAMNRLDPVKEVQVIDDFTVEVHLEEPDATLLALLTDAGNSIVPKEEVEGWGEQFGDNLIGTGPFKLVEWTSGGEIKLEKHENYWGPEPYLDELTWRSITDRNMMLNALRTGEVDVVIGIDGQNREIVEQEDNLILESVPGLSIEYAALNMMEGPTADKRVREAMNLAIDVDTLVDRVYQWGGAERSYLPLPKGSWGYDESLEDKVPGYDPERAKELLEEAGYGDGFKTEVYVIEDRRDHVQVMQNQLKENLNIDLEINVVEWGTFSDTASSGNAPLYVMGWVWYPDPYFFLNQLFHSNQIGALGNGNGYKNEEVDELLNRAKSETVVQEERAELYKEALEIIVEDVPHIELTVVDITAALNERVKDFKVRADNAFIIAGPNNNVWVEE